MYQVKQEGVVGFESKFPAEDVGLKEEENCLLPFVEVKYESQKKMNEVKQEVLEVFNLGLESKFPSEDVHIKQEEEEEEKEERCMQPLLEMKHEPEVLEKMIKHENFQIDCDRMKLKEDKKLCSRTSDQFSPPPVHGNGTNLEQDKSYDVYVVKDRDLHDYPSSNPLTHRDKFPFSCEICGKSFTQKSGLKTHLHIHTGVLPFSCEVCGKSFSVKCNLNTHLVIHSSDFPFSCEVCGKSFNRKSSLKIHLAIHSGDLTFSCEVCGKSFNSKNYLKAHLPMHTIDHPFSCEFCGKCFTHKSKQKRHMYIHK